MSAASAGDVCFDPGGGLGQGVDGLDAVDPSSVAENVPKLSDDNMDAMDVVEPGAPQVGSLTSQSESSTPTLGRAAPTMERPAPTEESSTPSQEPPAPVERSEGEKENEDDIQVVEKLSEITSDVNEEGRELGTRRKEGYAGAAMKDKDLKWIYVHLKIDRKFLGMNST